MDVLKPQYFEVVEDMLSSCKRSVQKSFSAFEKGQMNRLLIYLNQTVLFLNRQKRPASTIASMYKWIISILFEFGEFERVVEYSSKIMLFCHLSK